MGPAVWFRLNLGRRDKADPRRLLPMLTRRGGIGRQDIGAIRIFDRETKFEIRGKAAARFAEAFARNGSPEIQVEALAGDAGAGRAQGRPRRPEGLREPARRQASAQGRTVRAAGPTTGRGRTSGRG